MSRTLKRRVRLLLSQDDGISMIVTIAVMVVTSLLLIAAFTSAQGEIHLTSTDTAEKKAYYAAEAGIEDYEYHLTQDGNYLSYCTEPPTTNPALNQVGSTANRAKVPGRKEGEETHEEYAIQLLPAETDTRSGDHKCDPTHLVETMLEEKEGTATGTFRIESTGYSENARRTLVATFRNANFVSFVWYTKYETFDPVVYGLPLRTQCEKFYGERPGESECPNNFFIEKESVNGPMHTEDHVGVCGNPVFGRSKNDRIEFGSFGHEGDEGYSNEGIGCSSKPEFKGLHVKPSEVVPIEPPPGDEELEHVVESAYHFKGKTEIVLEGGVMKIVEHKGAGATGNIETEEKTKSGVAYPPNGVIYVSGGCTEAYTPFGPKPLYSNDTTCGNAYVKGEYSTALTIASQNDVIIIGNITTAVDGSGTPTTNAMLGLIANNFVRIYHPVPQTYEGRGPELEAAGHKETVKVEAKTPALAKELKVEVKESSGQFEVAVLNAKSEVVEHTALLKEAKELVGLTSPNVVYSEGGKYSEGKSEKLKKASAKGLNEICTKNAKGTVEKFSSLLKGCEYTNTFAECDAPNGSEDLNEPTVYAAILAVKHAVVVDNFSCGTPELGHLNLYGTAAALFSNGLTGVFSGTSIIHGYPYKLNYDDRLQVEEPPHFLNPIQAAWFIQRQTLAPNPSY
jgi:Tfp pilus assembly protein PilX